jgi:hypothetical protein
MAMRNTADGSGEVAELASLLWQVRESMQALPAQSNDPGRATALRHLNGLQVLCVAEADALAARLGRPPGATLAELAAAVDDPWQTILTEHRDALRAALSEADRPGSPGPPALSDFLA